jgi:hypothetical protein
VAGKHSAHNVSYSYFLSKAKRFKYKEWQFLGAFAKFGKAVINFVMSVRPSIQLSVWNNSTPTGQMFGEI